MIKSLFDLKIYYLNNKIMQKTQQNFSNPDSVTNEIKKRKRPRADFGRPVYWKPNFNGPKDKNGFILMTQQKTYAGICKREERKFNIKKKNYESVVGTSEYSQKKQQDKIKEIGDLVTK